MSKAPTSLHFGFLFCVIFSFQSLAQQFGYQGQAGYNGSDGRPGRDGKSAVVYAEGQAASFDLSGSDGERGRDGSYGNDATGCYVGQSNPPYNLQGADGGDGGCGGNGGRGGNAGDLTVYFEDMENLRLISVDARPGRGGRGGSGYPGGRGCWCSVSSWQAEVGGQQQTFYCNSGKEGMYGLQGGTGKNGSYGSVYLIDQMEPVGSETGRVQFEITKMADQNNVLSKNIWERKTGTSGLFASGSYLPNSYYEFIERIEYAYNFEWKANRPIEDFKGYYIWLWFNNDNKITWDHTNGLWHDGDEVTDDDGNVTYVLKSAVKYNEVNRFQFKEAFGTDKALTAVVQDNSGYPDDIKNEATVKYYTKSGYYYYERFNDKVPAELLDQNGDKISVKIGELPIKEEYLKAGTQSLIYVYLKRSVGTHSGTWYVNKYVTIE